MCACTYTMQRLDDQCIVVVKIENASFCYGWIAFFGARFQILFYFSTQCNEHSISDDGRGGHEYCHLLSNALQWQS